MNFINKIKGKSSKKTPPEKPKAKIVDLSKTIRAVGMLVHTNSKRVYIDIPKLARKYKKYKRNNTIFNIKVPWAFVAVSKDYNKEQKSFTYLIGDVVVNFDVVPQGLVSFTIPAGKYAVFTIRPRHRLDWAGAITRMKKYAYQTWLPNSQYQGGGLIDDFEYHDDRSAKKDNPEIDLYIAISRQE